MKKMVSKLFIQLMILVLLVSSLNLTVFSKTDAQAVESKKESTSESSKEGEEDKERVEIPSLRTENAKVFENTDGTFTSEVMLEPIHYKDGEEWKEIDNTIVPSSNGKEVENKQNKYKVKFPKNPVKDGYTQLFSYKVLKKEITFGIDQDSKNVKGHNKANNVQHSSKGNKVSYNGLFKDVNFDYVVEGSKVKENIVLNSYQGKNTFEFHIKGNGISGKKREDGIIEFTDSKTGEFLFLIQRPYMFDSSGEEGTEGALSHDVYQDITKVDDGYLLTVKADEKYLTDPNRVYPVTIDPWIDVFDAQDTYVSDKNPTSNFSNESLLYIGNDTARGKTRSLLKWNLPSIPNAVVTGGEIGLRQFSSYSDETVYVHKLLAPYTPTNVTWNTQPSYQQTPAQNRSNFMWGEYNYFPIDEMVKEWYSNPSQNHGVLLKYSNTTEGTSGRKAFYSQDNVDHTSSNFTKPKLVVYYSPKELLGKTDYWEYTPDIFKGEGTAVVNVINGNMVYDIKLITLPGKTEAFNLKLVYNSRSIYQDAYGYGWTLNAGRRLIPSLDKKIIEYVDEEGTRIFFGKQQHDSATSYTAPEGIFLELNSTSNGGYTIKQTDETVLTFDSQGRNTKIVDEKGNTILYQFDGTSNRITKISERYGTETTGRDISISYNTSGLLNKIIDFKGTETTLTYNNLNGKNRLESITYASNRTEKQKITFSYNNASQLIGVTDANGNMGSVEYDTSNRVQKIIDPRSTSVFSQLSYPSATETIFTDAKNFKTYYKNSGLNKQTVNIIEKIEDYQGPTQSTTKYEWDKNKLIKEIEPNKVTGTPDPSIVNQGSYDSKGNLTSSKYPNNLYTDSTYDSKSNITKDTENGATYNYIYDSASNLITSSDNYRISDYNSYDKFGNNKTSVSGTRITHNRIQNSNFERLDSNGYAESWIRRSIGQYKADSDYKYGKKSGKITLSGTEGAGYYTQTVPVQSDEVDKGYTVSAMVKTANLTGTGAQLRVYPLNSSNQLMVDSSGKTIVHTTSALKGTNDWTRISDFIQLPSDTAKIRIDLLVTGTGTANFDAIQLIYGATLDNYYSNEYGSMEWDYDKSTDFSKLFALGTDDGLTSEMSIRGNSSFVLNGVSDKLRYFGQYVDVQGKKGDPLTISGWSYGSNVNQTGEYELRLWFMYTDGTEEKFSLPFKSDILDQWQFVKETFRATKDFNRVKIYGVFNKQNGEAFFDNIKVEENGSTSINEYSNGNFKVRSINALNDEVTSSYDNNGNEILYTNEVGRKTSYQYDYLDRLKGTILVKESESNPENIKVSYEYDAQGNVKSMIDPRGNQTRYEYNKINEVTKEVDSLNKFIRYDYDEVGNLKLIEQGKDSTVQSKQELKYNQKNQLEEKWINGQKLFTYSYDRVGNVNSIKIADGQAYSYEYDENSRLKIAKEPNGYRLENVYDNNIKSLGNGLRKSYIETVNGSTYTTNFSYDILKRLTSINHQNGMEVGLFYNESHEPIRLTFGNARLYQDFDAAGQVISQSLIGNQDKINLSYTYYPDGNIKTHFDGISNHTYTYDFAGRLDSWTYNGKTIQYQYDKSGNLLNPNGKSLTFNSVNEVEIFKYDSAGNLLQDDKHNYSWDGDDQLLSVKDFNGQTKATFTYHPDGLRKTKQVGSKIYNYHYDDSELIRVTDGSGKTIWSFTWNNGEPISLTNQNGETFFYMTNQRGDVVSIVDSSGAKVASYSYDPWGNLTSAEPTDSRIIGQPIRYAGYYYDLETKLYYLQARYYDPSMARFLSKDPEVAIEDLPLSQNAYVYAMDNPVMMTDPDGNNPVIIVIVARGVYTVTMYYVKKKGKKKLYKVVKDKTKKKVKKVKKKKKKKKKDMKQKEGKQTKGTPRNNKEQNEQFRAVVNRHDLNQDQAQILHRAISKRNYGYRGMEEIAREIKRGTW